MKTLFRYLFILGVFYSSEIYAQCKGNLIFSDEFNGTTLDMTKWNYDIGNGCPGLCGWGNNEQEYYTSNASNINVSGGFLNITARYEPNYAGSGTNFTSAKIHTRNKFDRTYGRFEARMKLCPGTGMWPAFWMLPTNNVYGNWPTSGEIDIMEHRGDQLSTSHATLHYGSAWPNNQWDGNTWNLPNAQNVTTDFHIYAVEWTAAALNFYVDGALVKTETRTPNTLNPASNNAVNWPWDQNFYMIINLALGGWFSGNPTEAAILAAGGFPKGIQVDYVRVYDLSGATSEIPFGPLSSVALTLPGRIEAENYNDGCSGLAYTDTDVGNNGNVYRFDNVDIEACTDVGGGYNLGWGNAGEWTDYNVNVTTAGMYNFRVRCAGNIGFTSTFRVEVDGVNVSGTLNFPDSGGWQNWTDVSFNNVALTAGAHVVRFVFITGGFNVNYMDVTSATLPVKMSHWSAVPAGETVALDWTTLSEEDNDRFVLERSADGINFEVLTVIKGQGTTSISNRYAYIDAAPLPGTSYYRLKQVDQNGEVNICGNTLMVHMNAASSWEVYPVPVIDQLQLSGILYDDTQVDVLIYDSRGIVIAERKGLSLAAGVQYVTFSTDQWVEGVYIVNIIDHSSGTVVKKRLVKV